MEEAVEEKRKAFAAAHRSDKDVLLLLLPDPFRGMRAWRKTMEPQKPGNSPSPGPAIVERQRVAKE